MNCYNALHKQEFADRNFSIVPIRYEDRFAIMKWRNEQLYHLRQKQPLTVEDQEAYFSNTVSKLFDIKQPSQLLFSFLENGLCIGYGGLVHINWVDKNAEISFIMDTSLEKLNFQQHWHTFLSLIEKVAFAELNLHKIFTYAFDLRPQLYGVLESSGYKREATLKEHCFFEGIYKDVVIHSKIFLSISIRKATENDTEITYRWVNDEGTRKNSFSSEPITFSNHESWFLSKLINTDSEYFIVESGGQAAGIVRFDKDPKSQNYIIGINIAPEYRGKGLSDKFISMACQLFFTNHHHTIDAYIKSANLASVRSFEKANFILNDQLVINGMQTLKYQLKKYGK